MTDKGRAPIFCESLCPVCRGARAGIGLCSKAIQKLELKICGEKGCIWGQARTRYYGVTP